MQDPLVTLLAKQSAKSLREMDEAIGGQLDDLHTQRVWVRRALAEKGIEIAADAAPANAEPVGNSNGARPGRKRGDKRQAIIDVMRTDPARVWLPSETRDALAARGVETTAASVRVAMRRMGDDDELVRPTDGNGWLLPDHAVPSTLSSERPSTTDFSEVSTPVSG